MIDPTPEDIGRKVIYRDLGGRGKIEEGVITSFNGWFVFVRYGENTTSQATMRVDLEWSTRQPEDLATQTVIRDGRVESIDFVPLPRDPRDDA